MEFDGILGHNCVRAMKELRTVKNDSQELKVDLVEQIVNDGVYLLPEDTEQTGYTKALIDSMIKFLGA